jgi:hypothetical protein
MKQCFLPAVFVLILASPLWAEVVPAPPFCEGMVLQCDVPLLVFGKAADGEKVTVNFRGTEASAVSNGRWQVELPKQEAGGPFALTIQGTNKLEFMDVYVGDVWVLAGQSNIAMETAVVFKPEEPVKGRLRLFMGAGQPKWITEHNGPPFLNLFWDTFTTDKIMNHRRKNNVQSCKKLHYLAILIVLHTVIINDLPVSGRRNTVKFFKLLGEIKVVAVVQFGSYGGYFVSRFPQ